MAQESDMFAPGWPGIPARWTSSAKSGLGTAVSRDSRVWFTLSHGILNEIYYPRVDHACTRDLGFIVTDGSTYFSEEKRDARSETSQVAPGVPAYRIRNTAVDGRYRIEKEVLTDPWRDVVLQRVRFVPLQGTLADFRLYALLAPHLANRGSGNTAWVGDYKGTPMLLAERDSYALALACSAPWLARSVGFVGVSDGWQQLQRQQATDADLHARRERQRRADRRNRSRVVGRRVRAGARFRSDRDGSRPARAHQPARGLRRHESRVRRRRGRPGTRRSEAARLPRVPTVAVSPQRRGAADARIEARRRRRDRQPVDPVGLLEGRRRPGRLSPGVAARSGARPPAASSPSARATHARRVLRYPAGHAGAGRPLVAEHVARRHAVLARHSDGRNRAADSAGRSRRARRRDRPARARRILADGAARRRVSRPQRSRQPAGSLGRRSGLLAVHHRRRNRRAAGRRRLGRRSGKRDRRHVSARDRRRLERQHRTTGSTSPARHSRSSTASTAITSASRSPIRPTRRRRARVRADQEPAAG